MVGPGTDRTMVSTEKIKEEVEKDLADCVLDKTYMFTVGEQVHASFLALGDLPMRAELTPICLANDPLMLGGLFAVGCGIAIPIGVRMKVMSLTSHETRVAGSDAHQMIVSF